MNRLIITLLAGCSLAGCATTSFAPPGIKVNYAHGSGSTMTCSQAADRTVDRTVNVDRDVEGALSVVEAYIDAYDCGAREAADGRQAFEVPGFLIATGAAVAAALGAGPDLAILATGAGSAMNAGKAYYDPKRKALIYSHAVDALRCIRSEAMGIDNFAMFKKESETATRDLELALAAGTALPDPTVRVSAHQQYFTMVTDAAGAVSGVLGDNLSNVGTFNPAGTLAEIQKLLDEIKEKEAAKKKTKEETPPPAPPPSPPSPPLATRAANGAETFAPGAMEVYRAQRLAYQEQLAFYQAQLALYEEQFIEIDLKLLRPKLQTCVWRAKV